MLVHHKINAVRTVSFFASFSQKDHITIQRDFHSLEWEHCHQPSHDAWLVVQRATPVDVSVFACGGKWRMLPFSWINGDNIRVTHNQHRSLLTIAAQTSNQIRTLWIECENFCLDSFLLQYAFQIINYKLFIPRWITGVETQNRLKVPHRFF